MTGSAGTDQAGLAGGGMPWPPARPCPATTDAPRPASGSAQPRPGPAPQQWPDLNVIAPAFPLAPGVLLMVIGTLVSNCDIFGIGRVRARPYALTGPAVVAGLAAAKTTLI